MDILLLIIGFILLIKGADFLVDGGSHLAKKIGVSGLVIGLVIVGFGTSAPEFIVSLLSASEGRTDLSISNILGSNISNIFLILGITSIVYPIAIPDSTIKKEIPFLTGIAILLGGMLYDGELSQLDGVILLILFMFFMYYSFRISKNSSSDEKQDEKELIFPLVKSIIYIIGGLIGLVVGGKLIVDSAVNIATTFGLSEAFIGVTVVAIGTSLPELAASVIAAFKKKTDMAIGGVVGSNLFNVLWIGGATSIFFPIKAYEGIQIDLWVNAIATFLLLATAYILTLKKITKLEGICFVILYLSYIGYLIANL